MADPKVEVAVIKRSPEIVSLAVGDEVPMPNFLLVLSQKRLLSPDIEVVPVQKATWPKEPVPVAMLKEEGVDQERVPEPLLVKRVFASP